MTFEEWGTARDNTVKLAQETIESMKKSHSELCELLGSTYTNIITDEVRDYNENIMITLIEGDLYQIAAVLNKIAGELTDAPRVMFKAPEATSRKAKWIEHPHEAGLNWEYSRYECSECHVWADDDSDYCPNCGAEMEINLKGDNDE